MIEFITLFLGLVVGEQRIEVSVGSDVASVELRLDDQSLATLDSEPWEWSGDLGGDLIPRELSAVAFGKDGEELARARQWINLPSRRVEARLALDREAGGAAVARLVWQALDFDRPEAIRLIFDGRPVPFEDPERIVLPTHDPRALHFLRAEIVFSESVQAQAELIFGGTYGHEVRSDLTAVLVTMARKRLPSPDKLSGWFLKDGKPLEVAAIERGPVDVVVVRERSNELWGHLAGLMDRQKGGGSRSTTRRIGEHVETVNQHLQQGQIMIPWKFEDEDRVRYIFPRAEQRQSERFELHLLPVSRNLARFGGRNLFGILTEVTFDEDAELSPSLRLSDAVAIAGMSAAGGDRRRAVLLLRSGTTTDDSSLTSVQTRQYLSQLQVPLYHWAIDDGKKPGGWPESTSVESLSKMKKALKEFHEALDSQAVVWLEGTHLPRDIQLSETAKGMELLELSGAAR